MESGVSKNCNAPNKTANPPPNTAPIKGIKEINPANKPKIKPPSRPTINKESP